MCAVKIVSISESRCFSFQVESQCPRDINNCRFQSRNRDAFHFKSDIQKVCHPLHNGFNLGIEMLFISSFRICRAEGILNDVSISESRCFSFQEELSNPPKPAVTCFNLGIEMLFVSRIFHKTHRLMIRQCFNLESRCFSFQVQKRISET